MVINILYVTIRLLGIVSKSNQSKLALLAIFLGIIVLSYHMYAFNVQERTNSILISVGYIAVFMLNSLLLGKRFSVSFMNLKLLQKKTQDQNEEITSQAEMLNNTNNSLEAKVADRTRNLKEVAKELDTLLYRSSHDLKRPVTTILGLTQLANTTIEDKEALDLFEKIEGANQSMHNLISKLGQVMMIREHVPAVDTIDTSAMFSKLDAEIKTRLKQSHLLTVEYDCNRKLRADEFLCKTILHQLLLNSANWVDINHRPITIKCKITSEKGNVTLEVHDDGPGIKKELMDRIFEMYQVANDKIPGHGMGLYLVRKATDRLNGQVEIVSEANEFTRCIVTFQT